MRRPAYWLDLFTWATWTEFLNHGARVSGFRSSRWRTVQRIEPGDRLLCYLTGISRFIGILEVTGEPFMDDEPIWADEVFPCRVPVKPLLTLQPETALPVRELDQQLSMFRDLRSGHEWTGAFRSSPTRWKDADGEAVASALKAAEADPVSRPVDQKKLGWRPRQIRAVRRQERVAAPPKPMADEGEKPAREHTEIQWLLLKLGSDMGLDVWVARNDRGRQWQGNRFDQLPRLVGILPRQFDDRTNRIVELIDVLWLKGSAIVAAFEIEHSTTIYSGLLRMSDLLSEQPNSSIPLYLVAPDERRDKVISEINRPTFRHLSPPLARVCRFIPFGTLREHIAQVGSVISYLRPEVLIKWSASCEAEES